jgi:hypothetical protein
VTHVRVGSFFYPIKETTVVVSGIPFKEPQTIYWTKGDYEKTGRPVLVPTGVKQVNFVYNDSIPEVVPRVRSGPWWQASSPTPDKGNFNNGNTQINTATIGVQAGFITAYNREGRIFMELLGDATGPTTKRQLGYEIIEVIREPVPADVRIEIGERVTAYPDNDPSDAALEPSPVTQIGPSFAYQAQRRCQPGDRALCDTGDQAADRLPGDLVASRRWGIEMAVSILAVQLLLAERGIEVQPLRPPGGSG